MSRSFVCFFFLLGVSVHGIDIPIFIPFFSVGNLGKQPFANSIYIHVVDDDDVNLCGKWKCVNEMR